MNHCGWLIYNAGLMSKKFIEQHEWYERTAKTLDIELIAMKNSDVYAYLSQNELRIHHNYKKPDFVLFLDKDIRLARQLEQLGYPLYNTSETIDVCDDKISMYQRLAQQHLPIPKTIFAPMIFPTQSLDVDDDFLSFIETELGYPLVIKEAFGSFGAQVYLVQSYDELVVKNRELLHTPHLYQQFISSSEGRDVRLHVVGDRVIASMLRSSEDDFRANISHGGKMTLFEPPESFKQLAIEASLAVGAHFSGVDLLFNKNGEPIVCEVNSNAHIKNIYDCTRIDLTYSILNHIARCLIEDKRE